MIVAGADGLVAKQLLGGNEEWKHWGAAPLGLGLSLECCIMLRERDGESGL